MPALSLVVAARNAAALIGEALASVELGLDCEILLADGGSTDATVDIASSDPRLRVVSRSDAGIYDGMNRAIAAASGEAVMLLNSDDLLPAGAVGAALSRLRSTADAGWISGSALFGATPRAAVERRHAGPLKVEGAMFGVPAINARILRRDVLRHVGPIRTELGLAADREFLARLARCGARGLDFGRPLYFYRVHAGSRTISGDGSGYARVYAAEEALAAGMEAAPDDPALPLARLSAAVARAKRGLRSADAGALLPALGRPAALARGAALAWRWRGVLSGY